MIKKIFCLIFICSTLSFSLEKTRTHTEYFSNGKVKLQGIYIDNKKSGDWIRFDSEGYKVRKYSYINGDLFFRVTNYVNNGIIHSSGLIQNGKQEGEWFYYDKNGILLTKLTFVNGVKHGLFTSYDIYSRPIVDGYFTNGVLTHIRSLYKIIIK